MKIGGSFFRNKVAQRVFILFVLCSMLPILVLSILSYTQVSKQLKEQSLKQLQNSAKIHGMSIYERFTFLETDMHLIISMVLKDRKKNYTSIPTDTVGERAMQRFKALVLMKGSGEYSQLYGEIKGFPEGIWDKHATIASGKTIIFFQDHPGLPAQVYMIKALDSDSPESEMLLGEVDTTYLWGIGYENILPPMTDLCVINQTRKMLISSFPVSAELLHRVDIKIDGNDSRCFEYSYEKNKYYVSYWPMFLKSGFNAPNLSVVLRRAKADVLIPIANFKKIFPFVMLLSLWIVLLLSIFYIRKSLVPLEKLKAGTLRVAKHDFKDQVVVTSGDEFEELADSFNFMSSQLDRQFDTLKTIAEIDRAILSSLDEKQVINTAIKRMYTFFSCNSISISIVSDKRPNILHAYISTDIQLRKTLEEFFVIIPEDKQILYENRKFLHADIGKNKPSYLTEAASQNMKSILVLPLFLNGSLKGIIALGRHEKNLYTEDDLNHARQIADQVTVALSNSRLVEELEKLNLGTIEALARTVDAKSNWTAGHSERVANLSLKIAQVMGFNSKEIETLQRAAFLHDIGKIGIPLAILDKPDKLSDEEFAKIKEHPLIGARILEPIDAYADVLPMVLQHHEKFNGTGYPHGLAGANIVLGARILAVADVFDAVISDRPYRHGWVEEKAVKMITEEAGTHFDPKVVDAFLAAVS